MKQIFVVLLALGCVTVVDAQSKYPTPYTFTTLAGQAGVTGSSNGTGAAAHFQSPQAIALDAGGNAYVADTQNSTIRKVTSGGVVTTFVGIAGSPGTADGTGTAALVDNPWGVAVNTNTGILYVTDTFNDTVRKVVLSTGLVSTFAGSAGHSGITDGTQSSARFDNPTGIAVDSTSGNIYVSDNSNETIRKITSAGVVTTLAGTATVAGSTNATGTAAKFNNPEGLAVDPVTGTVYVADRDNHTIRKITSGGVVTTFAGTVGVSGNTDATGTAAKFNNPTCLAWDGSNLIVGDENNHTIRKITSAGVVTTLAGISAYSGHEDGTGFFAPQGIALDSTGHLYVADSGDENIRVGSFPPPLASLHFQNGLLLGALTLNSTYLPSAWAGIGAMNSGWQQRAIADINGDGFPDILFQNGTNIGALLIDANNHPISWIGIGSMQAGWELRVAVDFLGYGTPPELIFQNGTSLGFLYINASGTPLGWYGIGGVGAGWTLRAAADLNQDGQPELLFQNGTSLAALEISTSNVPTAWHGIGSMGAGWTLSDVADVNIDGQPELVFQNGTSLGALQINTSFSPVAWHGIGAMGSGWTLSGDY